MFLRRTYLFGDSARVSDRGCGRDSDDTAGTVRVDSRAVTVLFLPPRFYRARKQKAGVKPAFFSR